MALENVFIRNTNPNSRDSQLGNYIRRGEAANIDADQTFAYFKRIMVTVAGDVEFENQFGESVIMPALQPGVEYRAVGRRILSANTTATGIYVYTSE